MSSSNISKTQKLLGEIISNPKLTDKLLSRPPFRFIHDIVTNFIKATGFLKDVIPDELLDGASITQKDQKINFLNLVIQGIEKGTGKKCDAKPEKIVAGVEADKTNEMFHQLAACARRTEGRIAQIPAEIGKSKASVTKTDANADSQKRRGDLASKDIASNPAFKKLMEGIIMKNEDEKADEQIPPVAENSQEEGGKSKDEERRRRHEEKKREREKLKAEQPPAASKQETPNPLASKDIASNPAFKKLMEGIIMKNEDEKADEQIPPVAENSQEEGGKSKDEERRRRHEEKKRQREKLKAEKNLMNESQPQASFSVLEEGLQQSPSPSHQLHGSASNHRNRVELRQPVTAGKAPPKTKPTHEVETLSNVVKTTPVTNVIAESRDKDDQDENNTGEEDWLKVVEHYEAKPTYTRGAGAIDDVDVKGHLGQKALKAKREQEEAARVAQELAARSTLNQDGGIIIRNANRLNTRGGVGGGTVLGESEFNKLREQLQMLTKASNPLGRFLEAIHNDVDSMIRELESWRSEAHNQSLAALEARRQTEESLQSVQAQLQDIDDAINDQMLKTNNLRQTIFANEAAIEGMVHMIVGPEVVM